MYSILFFVSDSCPNCINIKEYYKKLELYGNYLINKLGMEVNIELYSSSLETEMYMFYAYDVQAVPAIICLDKQGEEINRYIGIDIIAKLEKDLAKISLKNNLKVK